MTKGLWTPCPLEFFRFCYVSLNQLFWTITIWIYQCSSCECLPVCSACMCVGGSFIPIRSCFGPSTYVHGPTYTKRTQDYILLIMYADEQISIPCFIKKYSTAGYMDPQHQVQLVNVSTVFAAFSFHVYCIIKYDELLVFPSNLMKKSTYWALLSF